MAQTLFQPVHKIAIVKNEWMFDFVYILMVRTLISPCLLAIFHPWWSKFCEPEAQGPFHQKSGFLLKCVDMIHFTVIFNVTVQMNGCMKEFLPQIVWLRIDKQITIYIQFDHKKLCQICKYMGNLPLNKALIFHVNLKMSYSVVSVGPYHQ